MSIIRSQVTSLEDFAVWMQGNAVPSLFKAVEYDSETDTASATDADDNVVLEIKNGTDGHFRAYRGENNYLEIALTQFPAPNTEENKRINVIGCGNGFIVDMKIGTRQGTGFGFAFMLSKTNNDKIAIIFPSSVGYAEAMQFKTNIQHVAFGDSQTMSTTTTFTPESGNQTVITPFITNADVGGKSYTPSAGYMPAHSNYGSGLNKFLLGADMYITNGYWCIKDGGAA